MKYFLCHHKNRYFCKTMIGKTLFLLFPSFIYTIRSPWHIYHFVPEVRNIYEKNKIKILIIGNLYWPDRCHQQIKNRLNFVFALLFFILHQKDCVEIIDYLRLYVIYIYICTTTVKNYWTKYSLIMNILTLSNKVSPQ